MYRICYALLIGLGAFAAGSAPSQLKAQIIIHPNSQGTQDINSHEIKFVLEETKIIWWPTYQYSYGELRSAYNAGNLTIFKRVLPDGDYYDISYGGVVICVINNNF